MHWNNGRFHESITVGDKIYITDHKHVAILGTKDYTHFGNTSVDSYLYGKNVYATANTGLSLYANNNITIITPGVLSISAKDTYLNSSNNTSIKASNNIDIEANNNVNITANAYLNLKASTGITINNVGYGTTLPTSGNTEGRIFFKLIS